jgi:hypothetical protein
LAAVAPLGWVSGGAVGLIVLSVLAWLAFGDRVRRSGATSAVTWDCGYAAPAPTMQYTASSFAQMLVGFFAWVLRPRTDAPSDRALFWGHTRFASDVPDIVLDRALRPGFRFGARLMSSFRFLQAGSIHAYLFYIVAFLIVLLLWR